MEGPSSQIFEIKFTAFWGLVLCFLTMSPEMVQKPAHWTNKTESLEKVCLCKQYLCAWIQHFSSCGGVENVNQVASIVINDFSVYLSWVWFRFRKCGVDIVYFAFQGQLWRPLVCCRVFHWLTKSSMVRIHFSVVFCQQDNIRECISPQKTKDCRERSKDVEKNYDRDEKEGTSDLVWGKMKWKYSFLG